MGADQALLELGGVSAAPVMRVYQWSPWCISLGYHQKADSIDTDTCRERGVDLVRRPTGGRAVFHSEELTYAVVVPKESGFYRNNLTELYTLISQGLARGIRLLGAEAELQKRHVDLNEHYKKAMSVSCFSAAARNEVLIAGRKLIGSAQRHLAWGMLQHGSILTGPAHLDLPFFLSGTSDADRQRLRAVIERKTVCLNDCLGRRADSAQIAAALKKGVAAELGISFADDRLTPAEEARAAELHDRFSLFKTAAPKG